MAEKPVYGGHDCEFVQEISDRLNCNICTKVLRDPHLAVCCGQHFCESCLNKWFTRQGKESCPHCRAEGEAFNHVIHKGLRSEINQLKIRCSNHGEGCQWTGEMGALKAHLESDGGCGYVIVACPNKCTNLVIAGVSSMKRKDLDKHLTRFCYLRPYQCEFCGHKDTYQAITGNDYKRQNRNLYGSHQAICPEAPLMCPNRCGADKIKRKDMKSHRSQCPQEPVECPFAEAGCKIDVRRQQLEGHMNTSLQQHLMLLVIDHKILRNEFYKMKAELDETKLKLYEAEARLMFGEDFSNSSNKLKNGDDSVKLIMPKFSEYRRTGKVWHSPPFYYRKGYKMCLAVYASGVGKGTGTHVSVAILHLKGEYDDQLEWPMRSCILKNYLGGILHITTLTPPERSCEFLLCRSLQRPQADEYKPIDSNDQFCSLNGKDLHLVNDCLNFKILFNSCFINVCID